MKSRKKIYLTAVGFLALALLSVDQFTKYQAQTHLKGQADIVWIPGVFELQYLENRGAAFGLLQNRQYFFVILCAFFLCAAAFFLAKMPATRRYLPLYIITAALAAGAAGNGIDRVLNGYVTDFFYFSLIDFPIFNMADIYVTVGGFFMFLYVCFVYREEDFAFLLKKRG